MPAVLTIYSCGTAFNRQRLDELTANLASRTVGTENFDWCVNDGPGSTSSSPDGVAGRAPKDARPVSDRERALADAAASRGFVDRARGIATGHGWEDNAKHSVEVVRARALDRSDPLATVNLLGWSRGAITCHMIANKLATDETLRLLRLRVNVFAIDPVEGPLSAGAHKSSLPPTVNEYVGVVMEDEARFIMSPTVAAPHGGAGSRHIVYPLPGQHHSGVKIHEGPVAEIVQHLAHNFLTRHGTQLRSQIRLAPERLCELYAMIRLGLPDYRKQAGNLAVQKLVAPARTTNPFRDRFFVNRHHAEMFKAAHPVLANALAASSLAQYRAQLAQLAQRHPATHTWATRICGLG